MIELRDVAIAIGGRPLLDRVAARVESGELVVILGPNGVGKTTLLRAVAGLHPLQAGTIRLDGAALNDLAPLQRARRAAFVTGDEVMLDALSVTDVVAIGRFPHHRWWQWQRQERDAAAVQASLRAVRMEPFAQRLFSTLSAGERQRVWIALGLAQETPILLLDEPTSHLDVRVAHEILQLLRGLARKGKSVVCALHDVNEAAAYADRIALLGEGTLLTIAPPESLLGGPLLERIYRIGMERIRLSSGGLRVFARESPLTDANSEAAERPSRVPSA